MSIDMFLELKGIKGESLDSKHKDCIEVLSWSWSALQSGTTHMGPGSGSGKASFSNLRITKLSDKSTPILIQYLCSGRYIESGRLVVRKAGGMPMEYIKIKFANAIITNYSTELGRDKEITNEICYLNFGAFIYEYTLQNKDGSAGPKIEFSFGIAANA